MNLMDGFILRPKEPVHTGLVYSSDDRSLCVTNADGVALTVFWYDSLYEVMEHVANHIKMSGYEDWVMEPTK